MLASYNKKRALALQVLFLFYLCIGGSHPGAGKGAKFQAK